MTSNFPDERGGLTRAVQFPTVPVQSPEGQVGAAQVPPLQFPLNPYNNYNPAHVPHDPPPQGPLILPPYSNNGIPYLSPTPFPFQAPPNTTSSFGVCSNDQFPQWLAIPPNASVIQPFYFVPQHPMHPMWSPSQSAIPTNVPNVETVNAAIHDEPQQEQEDGSEIAQPGRKPRYSTLP